jgi:capsid protein
LNNVLPTPTAQPKASRPRVVRARYDAERNGSENRNHWGDTDSLGPKNANSTYVRSTLSKKSRLERDNNPHMNGLTRTLANNFVGTGPRLQLALDADLYESTRQVEQLVSGWMRAVNFSEKLRLLIEVCPVDGETFGKMFFNPLVDHPIKLDLAVIEQEQVATPDLKSWLNPALVDGLVHDEYGNVTHYHILKEHPGDVVNWGSEYDIVPASRVVHWFRPNRPGMARGASEFASSIETCAQARRYAKATLGKQEINANITGVIETENLSVDSDSAPTFETMEEIDIPRMGLMTLPGGMKAKPFASAENTANFNEYMDLNHSTMGRPVGAPRNLTTMDSSGFNFASGKMDQLPYQAGVWIDRDRCRHRVLDKILKFLYALAMDAGLIPSNLPPMSKWEWDWHWDGFPSIDAVKDESACEMRLKNGKTTLAEENAAEGKDWREVARQLSIEVKYYESLGLIHPYTAAMMAIIKPAAPSASGDGSEGPPRLLDDEEDTTLEDAKAYRRLVHV